MKPRSKVEKLWFPKIRPNFFSRKIRTRAKERFGERAAGLTELGNSNQQKSTQDQVNEIWIPQRILFM